MLARGLGWLLSCLGEQEHSHQLQQGRVSSQPVFCPLPWSRHLLPVGLGQGWSHLPSRIFPSHFKVSPCNARLGNCLFRGSAALGAIREMGERSSDKVYVQP